MGRVVLKVLGGGGEVGRLSVVVRKENSRRALILDAGINFDEEDRPVFANTYPPKYVDAIVLSHAHLDHVGTAPMYYISGSPTIYATRPTIEMAKLMWADFLKLNGYYSPYEASEVEKAYDAARTVDYGDVVEVGDFILEFYNAGHIPGSMITVVNTDGLRIAFTGDINVMENKLVEKADLKSIGKVDVLVMEATYGVFTHPPRRVSEERLIAIIEEVVDAGGTVLVPAFSIARGQEIMMILAEKDLGIPVAVDGMIRNITEIMLENKKYLKRPELLAKAYNEFKIVRGWRDRNKVWKRPGVIIASAGMLKGGPSLYYLKKLGDNPKNAVVLVSFQAPGSPGRRLVEEGKMPDSEEPVKARVEWLDFSSHADQRGLLEIVKALRPDKLIIVHSELDIAHQFASKVKSVIDDIDVTVAHNNAEYVVDA